VFQPQTVEGLATVATPVVPEVDTRNAASRGAHESGLEGLARAIRSAKTCWPLSPLQEGLLFHALRDGRPTSTPCSWCSPLAETLDARQRLQRSRTSPGYGRSCSLRAALPTDGLAACRLSSDALRAGVTRAGSREREHQLHV